MSGKLVPRVPCRPVPTQDRIRQPGASLSTRHTASSLQKYGNNAASKELKDVLERKIEDLSRQLAQEKQTSRQNKLAMSRLQREVTRSKSADRPVKEQLSKELEHEKMLRAEAEHRLQEMTKESENCRSRLASLQEEFRKMENLVQDMVQYKSKIDQLKQEKSSLSSSYEVRLDKFQSHITDLERENMLLLNEVKKLESQMNHKHDGSPDRSRLLLERLKILEGENSSLVLENEQQRGQYEKCLDEIANQVVQALLDQKMLREECLKLQRRVHDLELQNRQLCTIVQHKVKTSHENSDQKSVESCETIRIQGSLESLQSILSDQVSEHLVTLPHTTSPSPWLPERFPGDRRSVPSASGSTNSTPEPDLSSRTSVASGFSCRTKIETEFPATPSSPKSKHVNIIERQNEAKRSSSVSSLSSQNRGPSKQRTRSTSSLSRVRGLSFLTPPERSQSNDSGIQNATTNELSVHNSQISADKSTDHIVPLNKSSPSISSLTSQGHMSRIGSKIPGVPIKSQISDETRLRRNSLKAEYGIRMGCQSPVPSKTSSSVSGKQPPSKVPTQPRSPSLASTGSQGHSRSPSVSSTKSSSSSKIPTVFRNSGSNISKSMKTDSKENVSAQNRGKSGPDRQATTSKMVPPIPSQSKLIPPRSPTLKYSRIKTTLKTDNASSSKTLTSKNDKVTKSQTSNVAMTTPANIKSLYTINPGANRQSYDRPTRTASKPPVPTRGDKPVNHNRPETHYPIMGLTNLNHTSPKNEDSPKIYANVFSTQTKSATKVKPDNVNSSTEPSEMSALKQAQYFYDYSDEDSDVGIKRPVSKDFSIASTVSLDELLDQTLENIDTPVDGDYSSDRYLFSLKQLPLQSKSSGSNRSSSEKDDPVTVSPPYDSIDGIPVNGVGTQTVNGVGTQTMTGRGTHTVNEQGASELMKANSANGKEQSGDRERRLQGKPDIVKDTEQCEQRNLQKSITVSQIPGSSMPGYRAKRPKSLILGANDKKFLYCEYGSSSSSDTSDEEWSYQLSYAKNIKQQEIQSKVAKSLQSGQAQLIESARSGKNTQGAINNKKNKVSTCSEKQTTKIVSQIPKANMTKKPSKIPPPIATKPVKKKSAQNDNINTRPKSVEICVNTVLINSESVTCYSYLNKVDSKSESVKYLNQRDHDSTLFSTKSDDPDITMNSTFDDVKVERSGSKDDGYSTMSSDVQPEIMEKYSDVFESSTNSNEIRNSNLSLSSQNSFSSEDRPSTHGSLGRVRAMKMKFDMESQKSPEKEVLVTKSPPNSPSKCTLKPPKPIALAKPSTVQSSGNVTDKVVMAGLSRIPKSKPVRDAITVTKPKSAIPLPKSSSLPVKKDTEVSTVGNMSNVKPKDISMTCDKIEKKCNGNRTVTTDMTPNNDTKDQMPYTTVPQTSTPKHLEEQFMNLGYFTPAFDRIEFLRDTSCDSNSSLSDRGSDLTSLHISEDNILSDIPEEKEGYESSVGHRSGNTSFSSLPNVTAAKKSVQVSHTAHTQHHATKFTSTLKNHWASIQGLCRAAKQTDYEQQKLLKTTPDYEELYGGCLNIETLNERSTSESDLYNRGDKPEVTLVPRLSRSRSDEKLVVDELAVEEQLQHLLKTEMLRQIQRNVDSADKDEANFTSFVELLIQRGHVMNTASTPLSAAPSIEESPGLNKMSVSNLSSKVNTPNVDSFVLEEKPAADITSQNSSAVTSPVGDVQKKFNSQFYSLCNTGSIKSVSDKSDRQGNGQKSGNLVHVNGRSVHTCQSGDAECVKCLDDKHVVEFDDISRQIESLSKTVNALHKSLTSLNSDNSDIELESNEGDTELTSAIGNKDIDGYQWVEDEFFLSPYGGEIILAGTGVSCEWMNEYSDNANHFEGLADQGSVQADTAPELPVKKPKIKVNTKHSNSILAGALDQEGNFDTKRLISQRLHQEEMKRRTQRGIDSSPLDNSCYIHSFVNPDASSHGISASQGQGFKKEELRLTPEKDLDETEITNNEQQLYAGKLLEKMVECGGSQDSLDDNIGVDNMMCHRLLGGKGASSAVRTTPYSRPALDFSNKQFLRFGDLEKEAVAAFDFLNDMTSSNVSDQSSETKISQELFSAEGRMNSRKNNKLKMTQSTTSNESQTSPVKRNRRKLRPKVRKEPRSSSYGANQRRFSSTSADSNMESDADISFSDSFCDSYSSSEEETLCQTEQTCSKNKTYI